MEEVKRLAKERGIAVLTSLHDLNRALAFGDKFFFLKDGNVCSCGDRSAVTAENIKSTFDLDVRIIEAENQRIIVGVTKNEH